MKQLKQSFVGLMFFYFVILIATSCEEGDESDKIPRMYFKAGDDTYDLTTATWIHEPSHSISNGGKVTISSISGLTIEIQLLPYFLENTFYITMKEGEYPQYHPSELAPGGSSHELRSTISIKLGALKYVSPISNADNTHSPIEVINGNVSGHQDNKKQLTIKFKGNLVRSTDAKLVQAEFYYSYE